MPPKKTIKKTQGSSKQAKAPKAQKKQAAAAAASSAAATASGGDPLAGSAVWDPNTVTPTETALSASLVGKVALVTGSGRGLGRAFAERLAALGCQVVIQGRNEHGPAQYGEGTTLAQVAKDIASRYKCETMKCLADLTIEADVDKMIAAVLKNWGQIDILVHNAGGDIAAKGGKPKPNNATGIPDIDVAAVLDRNLKTTILTNQRVARHMKARQTGRIINLSSVDSHIVAKEGERAVYSTAKAAINHWTRCLASELQPYAVNVNCLAPGATRSGRFMFNARAGSMGDWHTKLATDGSFDRVATGIQSIYS